MKRLAIICLLFMPVVAWAQKQYYLPTAGASDDEKDKPMIEVYLPQQPNGCAGAFLPPQAVMSNVQSIMDTKIRFFIAGTKIRISEQNAK